MSNAVVERMFSHISCIKTKFRNRLSMVMLDAILRVRNDLIMKGGCCKEFKVTDKMLSFFSSDMYKTRDISEITGTDDIEFDN